MMNELREQAERFGTKVEVDFISRVEFSKEKVEHIRFTLKTEMKSSQRLS